MNNSELKKKTVGGIFWAFLERAGAQGVSFIISIILARILMPEEYGIIALVQVFIHLANVFMTNGLNAALIQKKDADQLDYSTAFFVNLISSFVIYGSLFFLAPSIAEYYSEPLLSPMLRVLALCIPIGSVNAIQRAYVSKNFLFKRFFYSTLIGTVISGIIAVIMAYNGAGAWALVAQYLINAMGDTLVLWMTVKWRPERRFSFYRMKKIVAYGWKVLLAALMSEIYLQLRTMIIGKKYSSSDLAYYNRGRQFPELFLTNINSAINSVMFPAFSQKQDNIREIKHIVRKSLRVSIFILAPLMIGLAVVSKPLVTLVLTEKWMACVKYLQIYCFCYLLLPMQSILEQAYKGIGRSDYLVKLFIVEKAVGIVLILSTMNISVFAMAIGMLAGTVFSCFVHSIPAKYALDYSIKEIAGDLIPSIIRACFMGVAVWSVTWLDLSVMWTLLLQVMSGIIVYVGIAMICKNEELKYITSLLTDVLLRKMKK